MNAFSSGETALPPPGTRAEQYAAAQGLQHNTPTFDEFKAAHPQPAVGFVRAALQSVGNDEVVLQAFEELLQLIVDRQLQ